MTIEDVFMELTRTASGTFVVVAVFVTVGLLAAALLRSATVRDEDEEQIKFDRWQDGHSPSEDHGIEYQREAGDG